MTANIQMPLPGPRILMFLLLTFVLMMACTRMHAQNRPDTSHCEDAHGMLADFYAIEKAYPVQDCVTFFRPMTLGDNILWHCDGNAYPDTHTNSITVPAKEVLQVTLIVHAGACTDSASMRWTHPQPESISMAH